LGFLLFGCAGQPGREAGRGWNHMMGYGWYGGTFMWLILILIAGVAVYFLVRQSRRDRDLEGPAGDSPLEILKRRYAKGEITREEFERLREEIES
jgi:putative membrane protein